MCLSESPGCGTDAVSTSMLHREAGPQFEFRLANTEQYKLEPVKSLVQIQLDPLKLQGLPWGKGIHGTSSKGKKTQMTPTDPFLAMNSCVQTHTHTLTSSEAAECKY